MLLGGCSYMGNPLGGCQKRFCGFLGGVFGVMGGLGGWFV